MKMWMLGCLLAVGISGCCTGKVIRDEQTYRVEVTWDHKLQTELAERLRYHMSASPQCQCTEAGEFTDSRCVEDADWLLTAEYRAEWHRKAKMINAGLEEGELGDPPTIPPSVCPLPATPAEPEGE